MSQDGFYIAVYDYKYHLMDDRNIHAVCGVQAGDLFNNAKMLRRWLVDTKPEYLCPACFPKEAE